MEEEKNKKMEEKTFQEYTNRLDLYSVCKLSESNNISEYVRFLSGDDKEMNQNNNLNDERYNIIFPPGNTLPTIEKIKIIQDKIKNIEKYIISSLLERYFYLKKNIDINIAEVKTISNKIYFEVYLNKFMSYNLSYNEGIDLIKSKINIYYHKQLEQDYDVYPKKNGIYS